MLGWLIDFIVYFVVSGLMFQWGRSYERKQIEKEKEHPFHEPKEPTM